MNPAVAPRVIQKILLAGPIATRKKGYGVQVLGRHMFAVINYTSGAFEVAMCIMYEEPGERCSVVHQLTLHNTHCRD